MRPVYPGCSGWAPSMVGRTGWRCHVAGVFALFLHDVAIEGPYGLERLSAARGSGYADGANARLAVNGPEENRRCSGGRSSSAPAALMLVVATALIADRPAHPLSEFLDRCRWRMSILLPRQQAQLTQTARHPYRAMPGDLLPHWSNKCWSVSR